ncbi:3-methyl-2-oxobutanoate hydroxymethyltransferase [Prevotella nigrescens]|uniref:3-methyl-2-oxobutanoate hydroxymethyltransferase n=1 Tax=Prevotella nigrescens TaxID=28133 RepID=UPI001BADFA6F|nr:3-methyl-2-oxobutanoate hydroxymethyltransferase [Prevotella nigrescens]QUB49963.1 3-methyl-2-oxobutanoate hydroxymethyltransferase [Prevotella nigrescens]
MGYLSTDKKKITAVTLRQMKEAGEKIAQITAYDYTTAKIFDEAGIDSILVGDSASNVMCGNDNTLPITIEAMIYHAKAVAKACAHAFVVCDMPFGSYQVNSDEGVRNAIRIMKESGVDAVKLEGGSEVVATVKAIITAGIPVVGHLGLTPQSVHKFGGYGLRAKNEAEATKLLDDAKLLDEAGVCALVLEKVPQVLAAEVSKQIKTPTIGIGAGSGTDGQVLVYADAMGMTQGFKPKFLRHFADVRKCMADGIADYMRCVKAQTFPNNDESY